MLNKGKDYQWRDVVLSIGGKEIDFKSINLIDKNVSVFKYDIEIAVEDLISIAVEEYSIMCHKNDGYMIIVDGCVFKNQGTITINNCDYLILDISEERLLLRLISKKIK